MSHTMLTFLFLSDQQHFPRAKQQAKSLASLDFLIESSTSSSPQSPPCFSKPYTYPIIGSQRSVYSYQTGVKNYKMRYTMIGTNLSKTQEEQSTSRTINIWKNHRTDLEKGRKNKKKRRLKRERRRGRDRDGDEVKGQRDKG